MPVNNFWTSTAGKDPKRAYRFTVTMNPQGDTAVQFFVKSVGKPAITVSESAHTYLNHTFYYPGRVSWNTINMTLVDPVTPDAAYIFSNYLEDAGYRAPTSPNSLTTLSKHKMTNAGTDAAGTQTGLGEVLISQIDGNGETIEQWTLKNTWIKSVSFGDLDYESDALSQIALELRYDWAELTVHMGNAGTKTTTEDIFAPVS